VDIGCKNDGTITALGYNVFADLGAYHQLLTPAIPTLTGLMLSGSYKIPAIQMNVTGVFTNKMATDAYRGAGRPEATYVVERAMDIVAAELKMDPVEVRRKNFPKADEFPFHTATGLDYDSGDYEAALAKALDLSGYQKLREEQKQGRDNGKLIGIVQYGIGTFGSRATAVGGTAVFIAIQKLKEKAAKIAAHMMQCEGSRLSFEAGCYTKQEAAAAASVTGKSEPVVPVGEGPGGA